jgi:restriction endonuclease S subunit
MSFPRYPAYKDSGVEWLGEVPTNWNLKQLKHCIIRLGSGGTPESGNPDYWADGDSSGSVPWVAIGDMSSTSLVTSTTRALTQAGLSEKGLEVFPAGSLLYSIYASLGKVSILGVDAAFNQAILAIIPNTYVATQSFLKFWLESLEAHLGYYSSSNTQANLNAAKVLGFPVAVPTLAEQAKIATFLDRETAKIDALIAEQQRLIELLQEKRQAVISHAVTKGLNPDAPMKDSGVEWLGEVPEHWEIRRGRFLFGKREEAVELEDEVVTAFRDGQVIKRSLRRTEGFTMADLEAGYQHVRVGDLVIHGMDAFAGAIGVSESNGKCTPEYSVCYPLGGGASARYYALTLRLMALRGYIFVICPSVRERAPRFRFSAFKDVLISMPPLEEQNSIIQLTERERDKLSSLESSAYSLIDLLKERRSALISAAVTGQIDVRGLVPEVAAA